MPVINHEMEIQIKHNTTSSEIVNVLKSAPDDALISVSRLEGDAREPSVSKMIVRWSTLA
jgi:hypothetical protein